MSYKNEYIGRFWPLVMTHNLRVQNYVLLKIITSVAFDLGDIGRFETTSAADVPLVQKWVI